MSATKTGMKTLFCQISKIDEEKRRVTGVGASEAIDAEGEIFDYQGSKPHIQKWSENAKKTTKGKSFGNIREMHQLSAVGQLAEPIVFDDDSSSVILQALVTDDAAWRKCLAGTYTGFSIRGPVIGEKWSDPDNPGVLRYVCEPIEFSLVDLPCNPDAVFTAVKAGGVTETRKFQPQEGDMADANKAKTKTVDGEKLPKSAFAYQGSDEPKDWHLPIEFSTNESSAAHIRDAISRWDQTEMPDAAEKNTARARIEAAAKHHGIVIAAESLKAAGSQTVAKGMYDIADVASAISALRWTQDGLAFEAEMEGDGSPVPAKLKAIVADLCYLLAEMAREETAELLTAMKAVGAQKMVAKATTSKLDAMSTAIKAVGGIGDCLNGKCDHKGLEECAKGIAEHHAKATKALAPWADDDDDADDAADDAEDGDETQDSQGGKSSKKAAGTAPPTQGASPETGENEMNDVQKAQLDKAAKDSAEALEIAKANATATQQVVEALGKLTSVIAGEPIAAKSVGSAAAVAVSKGAEMSGEGVKTAEGATSHDVAKAILSQPRMLTANEVSSLRIGR